MRGRVLAHTQPQHACATPWRFFWRRLGEGARWQCDECLTIWEVRRNYKGQAKAGNDIYVTEWTNIGRGERASDQHNHHPVTTCGFDCPLYPGRFG